MLEEECKKRSIDYNELFTEENFDKLINDLKLDNVDDLFFNISILRFLPSTIINRVLPKKEAEFKPNQAVNKNDNDVLVEGYSDILTTLASCCNPVYGEEIVGYVSKGNGIKVHSKSCPNILNLNERFVSVKWNNESVHRYEATLNVYVITNLEDINEMVATAIKNEIYVESFNFREKMDNNPYYEVNIKVKDIDNLNNFINDLKQIKSVLNVERVFN